MSRRPRRLLQGLALSLATLAALLLLLEGGLRLAGYGAKPARWYDGEVGPRFHAHQTRPTFGPGGPPVTFTTNAMGFRGPWRAGPKPAGTLRVVCLGDSFTFGWGIGDEGAYPLQLERLLAADPGPARVEVTNLGMPDFNTSNALRAYRKLARPLEPDVVVLGWYLNDVQPDNLGPRYTDSWLFRALGRTALMEAFHYHVRGRIPLFRPERSPELAARVQAYRENAERIEREPASDLARPYWEAAMADLRALAAELDADGVPLLVAIFPSSGQVHEARQALAAGEQAFEAAVAGPLAAPQRRVAEEAAAAGVPTVDLLAPFARCAGAPFGTIDPGHPSELGFAVTAARLRDALYGLELVPGPSSR